jgi:hypothetical protein
VSAAASNPRLRPPSALADLIGRADELAVLEAALADGGRVAITGRASVGNSALALAHIAASGGRHRNVAWLHAG